MIDKIWIDAWNVVGLLGVLWLMGLITYFIFKDDK